MNEDVLKRSFYDHYYGWTLLELRMMNRVKVTDTLTFNSVLYLDLISLTENCTVSKIAELLQISKSSVTIKVNELVEKGYVTKTRSEADGRVFYLSISKDIQAPYDEEERHTDTMIKMMMEMYSEEELAKFSEMMDAATKILRDY